MQKGFIQVDKKNTQNLKQNRKITWINNSHSLNTDGNNQLEIMEEKQSHSKK